jgi:hypothetical protein
MINGSVKKFVKIKNAVFIIEFSNDIPIGKIALNGA